MICDASLADDYILTLKVLESISDRLLNLLQVSGRGEKPGDLIFKSELFHV